MLLPEEEQRLIRGLVVNKFRGDPALFHDGVEILRERGGKPVLGVVPFLPDLGLPEEDAVALDGAGAAAADGPADRDIAVIRLPHIANFDDFDALRAEPGVRVRFVTAPDAIGQPDAPDPPRFQEHRRRPRLAPRAGVRGPDRSARRERRGGRRDLRRLPDARAVDP